MAMTTAPVSLCGPRHVRVPAQAPDVVDGVGPGPDTSPRDGGVAGIDGDWELRCGAHRLDDGHDPSRLFGRFEFLGAGAGGFAPDIEPIGAIGLHASCESDGRIEVPGEAVAAERVRRRVEDAHDEGARAPAELTAA
jgi:hypothetical protein